MIEFAVVDFFAYPSSLLADELGIPNLINLPGPMTSLDIFGVCVPYSKNMRPCCGSIIQTASISSFILRNIVKSVFKSNARE